MKDFMFLNRTFLLIIPVAAVSVVLAQGQTDCSLPQDADPDKCYAVLAEPLKKGEKRFPEYWVDTLVYVYSGTDFRKRRAGWYREEFLIEEGGTRWEPRMPTNNVVQNAHANQLPPVSPVWCLVEPKTIKLKIVTDTVGRDDFEAKWYEVFLPPEDVSGLEISKSWQVVVCEDERTDNFYDSIASALTAHGYAPLSNSIQGVIMALEAFQREHGLAVGDFTKETLIALDEYLLVWLE